MTNDITIHILDMSKINHDNLSKFNLEKESSSLLISKYSGDGDLKTNQYGKPYKDNNVFFNVSHSNALCIIAVAKCEIGVDIEYVKPRLEGIEKRVFSNEELEFNKDLRTFYKMWTCKESLVKCKGTGIISSIKDIPALPLSGEKEYKGEKYYSKNISYENYEISVTCKEKIKGNLNLVLEN